MKKLHYIWMAAIILTALLSCTYTDGDEGENEELAADEPVTLTAFGFKADDNTVLENEYAAVITGTEVTVTIGERADLSALKPYFTLSGNGIFSVDNVHQISGVTPNNFFYDTIYTAAGSDGTSTSYTVHVNYDSAAYALPELSIAASDNSGLFISDDRTPTVSDTILNFDLPIEADLSSVQLSCSVFESFSVSVNGTAPVDNEVTVDLTEPAAVAVTTPSGEQFLFTITCTQTAAAEIGYFKTSIKEHLIAAVSAKSSLIPPLPDGYTFLITDAAGITYDDTYLVTDYNSEEIVSISYRLERSSDGAVLEETVTFSLADSEETRARQIAIYGIAPEGPAGINDECIILYNDAATSLNLNGYKIKYMTGTGGTVTVKYTFTASSILQPGGYMLIAGASFAQAGWNGDTVPDIVLDTDLNLSGNSGHLILYNNEGIELDRVGYGEASCAETAPAEYTGESGLLFRTAPGNDTDNNSADFSFAVPAAAILKNSQSL